MKAQHAVRDLVITHSGKEGGGVCYQRAEEREAISGRWSGVSLGGYWVPSSWTRAASSSLVVYLSVTGWRVQNSPWGGLGK